MFENIEVEVVDMVAEDGCWDDEAWLAEQAELFAMYESIDRGTYEL